MANRDIVVIGASAGGISALKRLCALLPQGIEAAIFVVLHIGNRGASMLDVILERAGTLPVEFARDGEPVRRGRIALAPPDHHLMLRGERMHLRRGARENLSRPAIDPLFRSAAVAYGARVVGVVLSGSLADGSAGLRAIKRCGGLALVQEPRDAEFPEMPSSAIAWAEPDHVAPLGELAKALIDRVGEAAPASPLCPEDIRMEADLAFGYAKDHAMEKQPGTRSVFSCPECQGALWEIKDGDLVRYRCHVGHAYSAEAMLDANGEELERALWSAMRTLEERAELVRRIADSATRGARDRSAERFRARAQEYEDQAERIRELLRHGLGPRNGPGKRRAAVG
jgi:two-component system chemotaxis response regulator CheB